MLLNAFSANMIAEFPVSVTFTEISPADARAHLLAESSGEAEIRSAVGHAETAAVFSSVLGNPSSWRAARAPSSASTPARDCRKAPHRCRKTPRSGGCE